MKWRQRTHPLPTSRQGIVKGQVAESVKRTAPQVLEKMILDGAQARKRVTISAARPS